MASFFWCSDVTGNLKKYIRIHFFQKKSWRVRWYHIYLRLARCPLFERCARVRAATVRRDVLFLEPSLYRRRFPLPSPFGVQRAHAQGPRFGWFWRSLHGHQPPLRLSWASSLFALRLHPPFVPFGSSAVRCIVALTGVPLPPPKYANFTQFAFDLNEVRWISKMVHWKATSKGFPMCHLRAPSAIGLR